MPRPEWTTEGELQQRIDATLAEFAKHKGRKLAEVREVWSERAAIREYLGGLRHRRNAHLHAVADTFEVFADRERRRT